MKTASVGLTYNTGVATSEVLLCPISWDFHKCSACHVCTSEIVGFSGSNWAVCFNAMLSVT